MAVKFKVPIQKPNFYLFTGGPGAGKSTVIELLAKQKRLVVPEVARNIIRHSMMPAVLKVNPGIHKVVKKIVKEQYR